MKRTVPTTNRDQQLEAIRAECIRANPEIQTEEPMPCPDATPGFMNCLVYHFRYVSRPVRLADVL